MRGGVTGGRGHGLRHACVLMLSACAGPSVAPAVAAPVVVHEQRPPRFGCDASGPTVYASSNGLRSHVPADPEFTPPLTTRHVRLLRLDDGGDLYFFDLKRPTLLTLRAEVPAPLSWDEPIDNTRIVVELPPLDHPGFSSSDPLGYLWRQEDLSITDHILCMDLHDRADDPLRTYNIRVDLTTATLERSLVRQHPGDRRGVAREPVHPRLCTPRGPSAAASQDGTCVYIGWHSVIPLEPPPRRAGLVRQ